MQYNLRSKGKKMQLDEIRAALRPFNLKRVAEDTGLAHATVWRFATGKTRKPTWQLVDTLERYVRSVAGQP
jgi:DNA-directed RNA polymerase specialized sigma54-like protein